MEPKTKLSNSHIEVKSNNFGYGLLLALACIIVFIVGLIILSIPTIIGAIIGFIIGLIIMTRTKIIVVPAKNSSESSTSQTVQVDTAYNGIDQLYFNTVRDYGEKLYLFLEKICNDPYLKKELYKSTPSSLKGNPSHSSSTDLIIGSLMTADILKIYQQLKYTIDVDKKEGFAMIYLFARIHGLYNLTFSNMPVFYDRISKIIMEYLPIIEKVNADNNSGELFLLGSLINNINNETGKQYNLLLYRYASLIAKADGTVSTEEANFLKNIISSSNININESEFKVPACSNVPEEANGMEQLNQLIGLKLVKSEVTTLINYITIQNMRITKGMKAPSLSYHCVFTGNPGTGKTTVARILAGIYKELGILKKGHLVETDRSGLVAEYVGQTAVKTNKIIDSAMDGVLFIDEAYSLITNSSNDYGKEAIATLLKRMEDDRERLIVILAGYTNEMKEFIDSNPGLQSRFNRYIEFKDYSEEELLQIFLSNLKKYEYVITDEATEKIKQLINKAIINKDHNFGNARWVRNIFEKTLEIQANRLASDRTISNESLTTITEYDIMNE